jgi:Zinc finger, C3HC4 type (RING finger)
VETTSQPKSAPTSWSCQMCTATNEYKCKNCDFVSAEQSSQAELRQVYSLLEQLKFEYEAMRRRCSVVKRSQRLIKEVKLEIENERSAKEKEKAAAENGQDGGKTLLTRQPSDAEVFGVDEQLWQRIFKRAEQTPEEHRAKPTATKQHASLSTSSSLSSSSSSSSSPSSSSLKSSTEFRSAIQRLEDEIANFEEGSECGVCFDAQISTTFWPCKHRLCCSACSRMLNNGGTVLCPLCRSEIELFLTATPLQKEDEGDDAATQRASSTTAAASPPSLAAMPPSSIGALLGRWTCTRCKCRHGYACSVCENVSHANVIDPQSSEFMHQSVVLTRQQSFLCKNILRGLELNLRQSFEQQDDDDDDEDAGDIEGQEPIDDAESAKEKAANEKRTRRLARLERHMQTLLERVAELTVQHTCEICNLRPTSTTFSPCGCHIACSSCARKISGMRGTPTCPRCSATVKLVITTYE